MGSTPLRPRSHVVTSAEFFDFGLAAAVERGVSVSTTTTTTTRVSFFSSRTSSSLLFPAVTTVRRDGFSAGRLCSGIREFPPVRFFRPTVLESFDTLPIAFDHFVDRLDDLFLFFLSFLVRTSLSERTKTATRKITIATVHLQIRLSNLTGTERLADQNAKCLVGRYG